MQHLSKGILEKRILYTPSKQVLGNSRYLEKVRNSSQGSNSNEQSRLQIGEMKQYAEQSFIKKYLKKKEKEKVEEKKKNVE